MKKFVLFLLISMIVLNSCSSDNNEIFLDTEKNGNQNVLSEEMASASINEWLKSLDDVEISIEIGNSQPSKPVKKLLSQLESLGYINLKLDAKGKANVNLTPKGQEIFVNKILQY